MLYSENNKNCHASSLSGKVNIYISGVLCFNRLLKIVDKHANILTCFFKDWEKTRL